MKKLCLFTNEFPYGDMEPYLETEIKYYDAFESVTIFALQLREADKRKKKTISRRFRVVEVDYASRIVYFFNSFVVLFDSNFYKELKLLIRTKRLSFRRLVELFVFLSRSHYEARQIIKSMKREQLEDSVFYSYRFEYQPYVACLVNKHYKLNNPIVSRAHRYDLYQDQRPTGYIPLREFILSQIEHVFPCSFEGKNYLESCNGQYSSKIVTKYLGTEDFGVQRGVRETGVCRIVSCSTVRPVKRISLIVDAIAKLSRFRVEWTHFGDGPLMDEIKNLADETLGPTVKVNFMGNVVNSELMSIYQKEYFDVFVNVSSSEGIPVSIMEACSFGIPVVATDVGGTKELVNSETGVLLPATVTAEEVANAISRILDLNDKDYAALRNSTRGYWEEHFDAKQNYSQFVRELTREL